MLTALHAWFATADNDRVTTLERRVTELENIVRAHQQFVQDLADIARERDRVRLSLTLH